MKHFFLIFDFFFENYIYLSAYCQSDVITTCPVSKEHLKSGLFDLFLVYTLAADHFIVKSSLR